MPVWCEDEAGPYQAIPQPGATWAPVGKPGLRPHEYIRGGTAKLLTLFRPATGEVRAQGVTNATNAVLHPWLQVELAEVLASLPPLTLTEDERPPLARWATWLGHEPRDPLPPLRLLLIWDNLAGHLSWSIVQWLFQHGVMPLYTPLSGSWLNMAERRPHQCRSSTEWRQPDGVYHGGAPRPPARGPWRPGGPAVRPASRAPVGDRTARWQPSVRSRHLVYAACRVAGGAQRARERAG